MNKIINSILLMGMCSSATAHAVAINQPVNDEEKSDSTMHQPITETPVRLDEVVVTGLTGNQRLREQPAPVSIVSHRQLESLPSTNIIDAISRQPGMSQVTTGSGISKPVIRGLGYNRVVVVNDGIRQEGQQWGDEHGVEIDAASVYSAEILKGPASLMYGSDAMAGVIVFRSAPIVPLGGMTGNVSTGYQTNSGLFDYSLNFAGNKAGFVWNSRYSGKAAHSYRNAYDGYVYGSAFREQAFTQFLGYNHRNGHTHLTLDYYHLTPGIIEGERDEVTGALSAPDGFKGKSYGTPLPYQQIHHYKAVLDNLWTLGDGNIKLLLGYQQNRRQEYEESRDAYGLYLRLHTVNYDLRYQSPELCGWRLAAGVNGMWQRSQNLGSEFLIPDYNLFDYGVFATASRKFGETSVSGGVRYDHRHLHSNAMTDAGENGDASASRESSMRFNAFSRSFDGFSASVGLAQSIMPGLNLKANASLGFRAPNISELAANGEHEGTGRYEIGNNSLKSEHSWQIDLGADYTSDLVSAELSLFANRISNYLFGEKLADAGGNAVIVDGTPAYKFTSGDARLLGGEARVDVHPFAGLHIGNSFSYVSSVQLGQPSDSKYLPLTPAPRWLADVRYEFVCNGRTFDNLFIKVESDCNLRQNHYYAANNTETATPSYTLFNVYAGTDVLRHGKRMFSLYLSCENLTDKAYQNHLSRLKYLDVNNATGRRGVYNMGRNFTMKLVVPINFM